MRVLLALLLLTGIAWADIKSPPPQDDNLLYTYLLDVKDNINTVREVTTNPDGNTVGKRGDIVIYNNSNTRYLMVCTVASSSSWQGILLKNID